MDTPQIVLELSASVNGGYPTAWKEYPDRWVIVVADGRKFTFPKNAIHRAIPTPRAEKPRSKPRGEPTPNDT